MMLANQLSRYCEKIHEFKELGRVNSGSTGPCRLKDCAGILDASCQIPFNSCLGRGDGGPR